jgi:hypothetical protein
VLGVKSKLAAQWDAFFAACFSALVAKALFAPRSLAFSAGARREKVYVCVFFAGCRAEKLIPIVQK